MKTEVTNKYKIFKKRFSNEGFNYLYFFLRIPGNYLAKFIRSPFFIFKNKKYKYFYHPHHRTWMTERAIEIPIILDIIKNNKNFLEIGNVLRHYVNIPHDVVDKYEKEKGVINEDVVSYHSKKKYDFIISISTMEHVGWDEEKKSEDKIPKSIENLKKMLKTNGKIIITVPVNYNKWLDKLLEKRDSFDELYFMKRKLFNRWVPSNWEEVKNCGFNEDARGLAILIIKN